MKKNIIIAVLFILISSFTIHKFYVSIYQVNYDAKKKMLQITARIFEDDLNHVLEKKYNQKTFIGQEKESQGDIALLNKYLLEHFIIKINGQQKTLVFLSKEKESNVIIAYYYIKGISKIKTIEIQNTALQELHDEQQNIMQVNVFNKKQSLLLTSDNISGVLKE
jgi:hypothetical protein